MPIKTLSLDSLRLDGDTQTRDLNLVTVQLYAEALREDSVFPPARAVFDGTDHWLYGGFHRYHAHQAAGRDGMEVEVRDGDLHLAQWLSVGENKEHDAVTTGQRRTNAEKRFAVERALRLEPGRSDRVIADWVGVDNSFVSRKRKEVLSVDNPQMQTRTVERGGKAYTMNTAGIGKLAPEPETPEGIFDASNDHAESPPQQPDEVVEWDDDDSPDGDCPEEAAAPLPPPVAVNGSSELKAALAAGQVSSRDASALASLPSGEQRDALAAGPEVAAACAAEVRSSQAVGRAAAAPTPYPHSDWLYRWMRLVAGETEVIRVEAGGIKNLLAEPQKWNWREVREFILPSLKSLNRTLAVFVEEIEHALVEN